MKTDQYLGPMFTLSLSEFRTSVDQTRFRPYLMGKITSFLLACAAPELERATNSINPSAGGGVSFSLPDPPEGWIETRNLSGNFRVMTPYMPKDFSVNKGNGLSNRLVAVSDDDAVGYTVTYINRLVAPGEIDEYLKGVEGTMISTVAGTLTTSSTISLGQHRGREFQFTYIDDQRRLRFVSYRIYFAQNRLYTLGVMGTNRPVSKDAVAKFFQSFALLTRN